MKHPVQIALQSWVSGRKSQRMSTAGKAPSKLAKNWPSMVFRGLLSQITEVEIRLYFQGFSCWWAQQDLNLRPSDYESSALTIELQARHIGAWFHKRLQLSIPEQIQLRFPGFQPSQLHHRSRCCSLSPTFPAPVFSGLHPLNGVTREAVGITKTLSPGT